METFRIKTVVSTDRVLTIRGVPFRAGEQVEVILFAPPPNLPQGERYPLRGKPYRYVEPYGSVAENDWSVSR